MLYLLRQQNPVKGLCLWLQTTFTVPCKTIGLIGCSTILWDSAAPFIMPLLTHGRFHEQPQRRRRSRPHGSECSSSVGGTSQSLERNLGNRKDHTALIIKYQDEGHDILISADEQGGKLSLHVTLLNLAIYDVIAVVVKVSLFSQCAAGYQTLESGFKDCSSMSLSAIKYIL